MVIDNIANMLCLRFSILAYMKTEVKKDVIYSHFYTSFT